MGEILSCIQTPHKKHKKNQSKPKHHKYQLPNNFQYQQWKSQLGLIDDSKFISFVYSEIIEHNSFKQISKDIDRTFPDSEYYKSEKNKQEFKKLLQDFSVYFPKTGYTQGINFIAGYLLMSSSSLKQSFSILCKICTHHNLMLLGLYQDQFPLIRLYCGLFWEIISDCRPNLAQKIKQFNVPDDLWIFQWFMTLFIYSFPLYLVRDFLTFILTDKGMAMVKIAYGIILQLQSEIMKCKNQIKFSQLCQKIKTRQFCESNLHIHNILSFAKLFSDQQIHIYMQKVPLDNNTYLRYFLKSENDRKMKNVQVNNKLFEERKQFLAQPTSMKFSRNMNDISLLDSLESINIQRLYHSLVNKQIDNEYIFESEDATTRMWTSDLMHLQVKNEQKIISQKNSYIQTKETSFNKDIINHQPLKIFKKKK